MSIFSEISKSMSQIAGVAGALPPGQLGQINKVIGKTLADAGATKSMAGLEASIGKAIKNSISGLSEQQKQAMTELVKSKLGGQKAGDGSVKPGDGSVSPAAMAKIQQLLQQQKQLSEQISTLMKTIHKQNASIINNMK